MVSSIGSTQTQGVQQFQKPDPSQMFSDLSKKVGADDAGITKENLESYLTKLQEDGKGDGREARLISKMVDDFDTLSGGSDQITADSMKTGMESLKPQGGPPPKDAADMFGDLSQKVGADDSGITKDDLQSYLEKLQKEGNGDGKEAEMISNLIEDFDNASGGTDCITSDSLQKAFQSKRQSGAMNREPQDPATITVDQLQSPIDIRI